MSLKPITRTLRDFIEHNRQTGSTTIAIESALKHGAYYIVTNYSQKQLYNKKHPHLKIFTVTELESERFVGYDKCPVIIDPSVIYQLCCGLEYTAKHPVDITINQPLNNQVNVKLSDDQLNSVKELNNEIFEGTASLSNIVRLLIVKGLKYYKEII